MALSLTCRRLLYRTNPTYLQCRKAGYYVLLPEVPQDQDGNSDLLKTESIPEFSLLTAEKCFSGMVKIAFDHNSSFWNLEDHVKGKGKSNLTTEELFQLYLNPLELISRSLDNARSIIAVLATANNSLFSEQQKRDMFVRAQQVRGDKFRSPLLYYSCKNALENAKPEELTEEQERLIKKYLLEGKLKGMGLNQRNYERLLSLEAQLAGQQATFGLKNMHSTKLFKHQVSDRHMMKNFPKDVLEYMCDGIDPARGPWTVTLQPYIYKSFLEHCPDSLSRWNVWHASVSRGIDREDLRTNKHLQEIREYRKEIASLLGYENYAALSMETKMAGSVDNVNKVFNIFLEKARPAQAREIEYLTKFALQNGFHKELDVWDVEYWKRQQQLALFNFNEDSLTDYFPLDTVLNGLFSFVKDLFGVEIQERIGVELWHPDVRFYDVFDHNSTSPVGSFCIDLYERPGKHFLPRNNGFTVPLRQRSTVGTPQLPISTLLFSFKPPSSGTPCLLSFSAVQNLFSRFGHALRHVLTHASYIETAGASNVEWDAVDVPSNFMQHWLYTHPVLERISGHYKTGEKVPIEAVDSLARIRKHMTGYALCKEVYLSRFDLEVHSSDAHWTEITKKLWQTHLVFPLNKEDDHPLSFTEIFTEEWGAAFYSRLWAKMVAADAFSAFKDSGCEEGEDLAVAGKRFRDTFLSLGGTCHSSEVFRRFRGRDPLADGYLQWLGLQSKRGL